MLTSSESLWTLASSRFSGSNCVGSVGESVSRLTIGCSSMTVTLIRLSLLIASTPTLMFSRLWTIVVMLCSRSSTSSTSRWTQLSHSTHTHTCRCTYKKVKKGKVWWLASMTQVPEHFTISKVATDWQLAWANDTRSALCGHPLSAIANNWTQSNNNQDNVYGAVIVLITLREFTRFIWWMQLEAPRGRRTLDQADRLEP